MSKTMSGRHEVVEVGGRWHFRPTGGEVISDGFATADRALAAAEGFESDNDADALRWAKLARPEDYATPAETAGTFDVFADDGK